MDKVEWDNEDLSRLFANLNEVSDLLSPYYDEVKFPSVVKAQGIISSIMSRLDADGVSMFDI